VIRAPKFGVISKALIFEGEVSEQRGGGGREEKDRRGWNEITLAGELHLERL